MPEVLAIALDLPSLAVDESIETLSLALRDWLGDRWPTPTEWFVSGSPAGVRSSAGRFRWEPFAQGNLRIVDFVWTHADSRFSEISWSTHVTLHNATPHGFHLELIVSNTGPEPDHPATLLTGRPRLLLVLNKLTDIRCGGIRLRPDARVLTADDIPDFVRYELIGSQRTIPLLALSTTEAGLHLVQPSRIIDEYTALAEVVVLDDAAASWALTKEVGGKQLSVFGGALRCYLPDFALTDNPFRHPLLLPTRAVQPGARLQLAQRLALATVSRFRPSRSLDGLRSERAIEYAARTADALARIAAASPSTSPEDATALEQLAEREDQLVSENNEQRREIERQRATIAHLRYDLRLARGESSATAASSPDVLQPASVLEAVEIADQWYRDNLVLLPSAFDAAENSPFREPGEVLKVLSEMGAIAASAEDGRLGRDLFTCFRERGRTYKSDIGDATSADLRRQYDAVFEGDRYSCVEHVRLGTTMDPEDCLVVYFSSDMPHNRFIIKSVGRHFENMTST